MKYFTIDIVVSHSSVQTMPVTNCSIFSCPVYPVKALVELYVEGVAIPVVGGLGLGGNVAAILVLR